MPDAQPPSGRSTPEELSPLRIRAALYRIEGGMRLLPDDASVLARAYRIAEETILELKEGQTCDLCGLRCHSGHVYYYCLHFLCERHTYVNDCPICAKSEAT